MAKSRVDLHFSFVNPNTQEVFEKALTKILIDKLLSLHPAATQK